MQAKRYGREKHPFCGGAVLTENYIITAAHCFPGRNHNTSDYYILLGDYYITDKYDGQESFDVAEIKIHPGFNSNILEYTNDIALLRLSTSAKFSVKIGQVCLPSHSGNVLCRKFIKDDL